MRAVTLRGSWPPSCRIGPGPHGTWRAMPASVPQPTGAPDTACRQRRPASPHRCVGCAPYSRVWRQRHGLKDCHTLCPDTGVGVPPQWAVVVPPQWRPGSPPTAWHRARLLPQPQCSRGRPLHPQGDSAWYQPCHDPSGWAQSGPPKTCLAHRSVCRLPFPVHAIQLFAPLHKGSPHSVQDTRLHPPLKGAMNGAVVPKLFRQSVPLASAAQPEDDAVEHRRGSARLRPLALGGSSSRMIGSTRSQSSSGTSQMVSSVSCFPMRSLPMLLEKPYESSRKPVNAFVVQILR